MRFSPSASAIFDQRFKALTSSSGIVMF